MSVSSRNLDGEAQDNFLQGIRRLVQKIGGKVAVFDLGEGNVFWFRKVIGRNEKSGFREIIT